MAEAREQPSPVPECCWHCAPGRTCTGALGPGCWGGMTPWHCRALPEPRASNGVSQPWEQALQQGSLESSLVLEQNAEGMVC